MAETKKQATDVVRDRKGALMFLHTYVVIESHVGENVGKIPVLVKRKAVLLSIDDKKDEK